MLPQGWRILQNVTRHSNRTIPPPHTADRFRTLHPNRLSWQYTVFPYAGPKKKLKGRAVFEKLFESLICPKSGSTGQF